tara:strand:- start:115 stop:288 length:174 start_codon:yes stop_codon:yes gene_type:complete
MSTIQALLVGGLVGFILGSIAWLFLGFTLGILQNGVEDALRDKLELEKTKENENGSS